MTFHEFHCRKPAVEEALSG